MAMAKIKLETPWNIEVKPFFQR